MKIDEPDLVTLMRELEDQNKDTWIEVQSEIHYYGGECPIWFLVASKEKAIATWEVFLKVIGPYLNKFQDTEFATSFRQLAGSHIIWWDSLDDAEIRKGQPSVELCKYPDTKEIKADHTTVFDTVKRHLANRKVSA